MTTADSRRHPRVPGSRRDRPNQLQPAHEALCGGPQVAFIPLSLDNPGRAPLTVRPSALLEALIALFELLWDLATPINVDRQLDAATADTMPISAAVDMDLLILLAAGAKDQAIARQLGVGLRTVVRRTSKLMQQLGAESRFQAGLLQARALGLLSAQERTSQVTAADTTQGERIRHSPCVRAGPILGQYLWPAPASCGASRPLSRTRTALFPIASVKLRGVRFPFSALSELR